MLWPMFPTFSPPSPPPSALRLSHWFKQNMSTPFPLLARHFGQLQIPPPFRHIYYYKQYNI